MTSRQSKRKCKIFSYFSDFHLLRPSDRSVCFPHNETHELNIGPYINPTRPTEAVPLHLRPVPPRIPFASSRPTAHSRVSYLTLPARCIFESLPRAPRVRSRPSKASRASGAILTAPVRHGPGARSRWGGPSPIARSSRGPTGRCALHETPKKMPFL